MKKLILPLLAVILFTACDMSQPVDKQAARANKLNGLLIFVHSEPMAEYQVISRLEHDAITETLQQGKDKKFGQALGDMLNKTVENMNLREQLYKMTELAKKQAPQAEGLIINDKVFEAQIIRFK